MEETRSKTPGGRKGGWVFDADTDTQREAAPTWASTAPGTAVSPETLPCIWDVTLIVFQVDFIVVFDSVYFLTLWLMRVIVKHCGWGVGEI